VKAVCFFSLACLSALMTACTVYEDVDPHMKGWRSPALSALDQFGQQVDIKHAISGPWAVVFFYPKADTPG
jgi:hypothetical protein